jgi:hypothetical protein
VKSDDNCRAGTDTDASGFRPGVPIPPTVLVTEMDNGTLVLQGRPDGPRVHLSPKDAVPLRRELAAAFVLGDVGCAVDQERRSD